jgi:GT2 family glycosyltransferase
MVELDKRLRRMPDRTDKCSEDLRRQMEESAFELDQLRRQVRDLECALVDVQSSMTWELARVINATINPLVPLGSRRRRFLKIGYQCVRAIPKLREHRWVAHNAGVLPRTRGRAERESLPGRLSGDRLGSLFHRSPRLPSAPLKFPNFDHVVVSIIIPVFNNWAFTFACLGSIQEFTDGLAYEVIVSDNASTDETAEMMKWIEGVTYSRNDQNLGFIGSCNKGATRARGEFLLFLNNDTVVTPGWLDWLLATFHDVPGTGLAGAKLVFPDGRLQDAGGAIWNDASGWNYGKFRDPDHPRYNFVREVDYCTGACIMVPRALFERFGGFDTLYKPAYYEDTDLAFKIREAGYKVVYQPLSKVVHYEGLTHGRSVQNGVKSYQIVNQEKFRTRWNRRLAAHPETPHTDVRIVHPNGLDSASRGQVLVIDRRLPMADRDADSVRMLELLRSIRRTGHHVTFIPDDLVAGAPYRQQAQRSGVEVIHRPFYDSVPSFLSQHGHDFDLVIVSRAEVAARHMASIKHFAPCAKVIFDAVDLNYLRSDRETAFKQDKALRAAVARRKQQEFRLARLSNLTLVASTEEMDMLAQECSGLDIIVFPRIYTLEEREIPGVDNRCNLIFIGSFEQPSETDAILYFVREIFPLVAERIPQAVFQVIGDEPPPEIRRLSCSNIEILGCVADVRPCVDRARISVVPMRSGACVKGKLNPGLALGVPTVLTSIAAEGLSLVHEENAMIADDPRSFAEAIDRVWNSVDLWERLSAGGRRYVQEHFSAEVASRHINELLAWTGLSVIRDEAPCPGPHTTRQSIANALAETTASAN